MGGELVDLLLILCDDHAAAGVGDDERDVGGGVGRRIHRGGRAARAHRAEIREDPLVPRRRRERDAVLRFDAQGDQAGGDETYAVAGLLPGRARPSTLAVREAEGSSSGLLVTRSMNSRASDGARCSTFE